MNHRSFFSLVYGFIFFVSAQAKDLVMLKIVEIGQSDNRTMEYVTVSTTDPCIPSSIMPASTLAR